MLVSKEGFIAVGFFNIPAGLDLNNNRLTLNTSVTISQTLYYIIEYHDQEFIDLIQGVKVHTRNQLLAIKHLTYEFIRIDSYNVLMYQDITLTLCYIAFYHLLQFAYFLVALFCRCDC